jgi:hypothetical protein
MPLPLVVTYGTSLMIIFGSIQIPVVIFHVSSNSSNVKESRWGVLQLLQCQRIALRSRIGILRIFNFYGDSTMREKIGFCLFLHRAVTHADYAYPEALLRLIWVHLATCKTRTQNHIQFPVKLHLPTSQTQKCVWFWALSTLSSLCVQKETSWACMIWGIWLWENNWSHTSIVL